MLAETVAEASDCRKTAAPAAEEREGKVMYPGLLLCLRFAGSKAEVPVKKRQGLLGKRCGIRSGGKFQIPQHLRLPGRERWGLAHRFEEVGLLQNVCQGGQRLVGAKRQHPAGIPLPEHRQGGPQGRFQLIDGIFQSQPDQLFIHGLIFAAVKGGEERLQCVCPADPAGRADDAVPVQVGPAFGIIGFEIRFKGVVPGGIPDQVPCPALLTFQYFHQANTSS